MFTKQDYQQAVKQGNSRLAKLMLSMAHKGGVKVIDWVEDKRLLKIKANDVWCKCEFLHDFLEYEESEEAYFTLNTERPSGSVKSYWVLTLKPYSYLLNIGDSILLSTLRPIKRNGNEMVASPKLSLALDKELAKRIKGFNTQEVEARKRVVKAIRKMALGAGWHFYTFKGLKPHTIGSATLNRGDVIAVNPKFKKLALEKDETQTLHPIDASQWRNLLNKLD